MPADADVAPPAKRPLKARLKALFERYGMIAIVTYVALSLLMTLGLAIAIWVGAKPSTESGVIGVLIGAWIANKAFMPIRIPIALALTPGIDALVRRWRRA